MKFRRPSIEHVTSRLVERRPGSVDPAELTEHGIRALEAARSGEDLYVLTADQGYRLATPAERAAAERLAQDDPLSLIIYAARRAKRRRKRNR